MESHEASLTLTEDDVRQEWVQDLINCWNTTSQGGLWPAAVSWLAHGTGGDTGKTTSSPCLQ